MAKVTQVPSGRPDINVRFSNEEARLFFEWLGNTDTIESEETEDLVEGLYNQLDNLLRGNDVGKKD